MRIDELLATWEACFGTLSADAGLVFWVTTPELARVECVSAGFGRVWGTTGVAPPAGSWPPCVHPDDRPCIDRTGATLATTGRYDAKYRILSADGVVRWIHDRALLVADERGEPVRAVGLASEITADEATRSALHARTEELAVVSRGFASYLASGSWHSAALEVVKGALELTGSRMGFFAVVPPDRGIRLLAWAGEGWDAVADQAFHRDAVKRSPESGTAELPIIDDLASAAVQNGRTVLSNEPTHHTASRGLPEHHPAVQSFLGVPVTGEDRVIGLIALANRPGGYDARIQQQTEVLAGLAGVLCQAYLDNDKRKGLEEQLRHSQRMEAVGRLAGGIAHDFNNLLQVINGYSDLMLEMVVDDPALHDVIDRIRRAGGRAANLTRQLLAFSRKQVLEPRVLDLAELVSESQKLFLRLIGEDIEVMIERAERVWPILADPGQLEQVLMNLVVNARDAMPDGGRIVIETANVLRDATAVSALTEDIPPGRYVRLSVSDTGEGIPPSALPHIFEPFFTTKSPERGTGLGLSTVHGIVAQSGGYVRVYSELGRGTTFHVYLPVPENLTPGKPAEAPARDSGGSETVLLVEDEADIRAVCEKMLQRAGYTVLLASHPPQALEILNAHDGPIHLLLTDVVMPGGSGPALVNQMRRIRPDTAVVYMAGYTEHASLGSGLIEPGSHFLHKPFDRAALLGTLREALGNRPGGMRSRLGDLLPRALVVDDAIMNCELVQGLLQNLNWTCELADGGPAGLEKLQNETFDLVLLDVHMPGMDGHEVARRIRERPANPQWRTSAQVPIVGISAFFEAGDHERCRASGMNDFVAKPVGLEDLSRVIKRWYRGWPEHATGDAPHSGIAERLRELERELGRSATLRFACLFLADLVDRRVALRQAALAEDPERVVAAAHAIRGSCVNLGGRALASICRELEVRARARALGDVNDLLRLFDQEADRVQVELAALTGA